MFEYKEGDIVICVKGFQSIQSSEVEVVEKQIREEIYGL